MFIISVLYYIKFYVMWELSYNGPCCVCISLFFLMGVSGWMFLLVPADPGSPGQRAVKRSYTCVHIVWYRQWWCKRKINWEFIVRRWNKIVLRTRAAHLHRTQHKGNFPPLVSACLYYQACIQGCREEHLACKNWVMRCWCGYLSGARCRLFAYGPADATASQNPISSCLI